MSAVFEKQASVAVPVTPTSLISRFAHRYNVDPAKLLSTLKATAFSVSEGEVSNEQMMGLLIVADQYRLNPFTKEIYAFPDKKRGGIVPVVGVDGWARIVNEHEAFDGVEFIDGPASDKHKGAPEWIECVMYRKDRQHPTRIRERLIECYRDTGPWDTHPARLLRHKAYMQCGRIAFAFVGIYDEDEAQRIIEGEAGNGHDESPGIASINKTINRGKATIEGESERVDTAAPANEPKTEAAQGTMPDTKGDGPRTGDSAPGFVTSGNERPSGGLSPNSPASASVLTVVDYIARMAGWDNEELLALWADAEVPVEIRQGEKFMRAYKLRLDAIKGAKK